MTKRTWTLAALIACFVALPAAQAGKLGEVRTLDPQDMAKAGMRFARTLNSRGQQECGNVMCHLAFQETEKMSLKRLEDRMAMIDS